MKEEIQGKVSRILSHDSNVSEKLSQSTMTHVEHSRLILEVLEEDIPTLFERIEQLEKVLTIVKDTLEHKKNDDRTSWSLWNEANQALGKEE